MERTVVGEELTTKEDEHSSENDERTLTHSRMEILAVLRGIRNSHASVTAYFDDGEHEQSIRTAILDVMEERNILVLDYGVNEFLNRRILKSEEVVFVTTHNGVQVQFTTGPLKRVRYDKMDAFKAEIPDSLVRMQRREFYRIDTPIVDPIICLIPKTCGVGLMHTTVMNLSVGGVCIEGLPPNLETEQGMIFENCRIMLPENGTLTLDLEVLNIFEIEERSGHIIKRYGCQFVDIDEHTQTMIQRYITQLERERRAGKQ